MKRGLTLILIMIKLQFINKLSDVHVSLPYDLVCEVAHVRVSYIEDMDTIYSTACVHFSSFGLPRTNSCIDIRILNFKKSILSIIGIVFIQLPFYALDQYGELYII